MNFIYIDSGAHISADGKYRYRLWREWRNHPKQALWNWWKEDDGSPVLDGAGKPLGEPQSCVFVMLNPSTADGQIDDPTIRRCVAFAVAWHFDRLDVVNLFAYRATDPKQLLALSHKDDPVGVRNQETIQRTIENAGVIVCAWGAQKGIEWHVDTVRGWLGDKPLKALGFTKDGHPRHPLYVAADTKLEPLP